MEVHIKPYNGTDSEGWVWNGKVLRPYLKTDFDGWVFDGNVIRPYLKTDTDGWVFNGKVIRPYLKTDFDGWVVDGDVPIPVLAVCAKIIPSIGASRVTTSANTKPINQASKNREIKNGEDLGAAMAEWLIDLMIRAIKFVIVRIKERYNR